MFEIKNHELQDEVEKKALREREVRFENVNGAETPKKYIHYFQEIQKLPDISKYIVLGVFGLIALIVLLSFVYHLTQMYHCW